MKVAMWGLGILALSIVGMVLFSTFGNITVTNQLNYTTMKNTVEAAMYDSLDIAHYRTGFCLCTSKKKVDGKWSFTSSDEYIIKDIENNSCPVVEGKTCELLEGEYKIDKKKFAESLVRRFAEMVDNSKEYNLVVQDVIEYPPKASVMVKSFDDQLLSSDEFTISNQIDAILESKTEVFSTE